MISSIKSPFVAGTLEGNHKKGDVELQVFKTYSSPSTPMIDPQRITLLPKNSSRIKFYKDLVAAKVVAEQIQNFIQSIIFTFKADRTIETLEGRYEGDTENGIPCGHGTVTVPAGSFSGIFKDGLPNGSGVMQTYSYKIEGTFVDGLPHGHGKAESCDPEKLMEFVKDGYLDVERVKNLPTYATYEGRYEHGVSTGRGRLIWDGGNVYEGEFLNNKMHGKGRRTNLRGDLYEGDWQNGNPHGVGESRTSIENGITLHYSGEMKYGKRHGQGSSVLKNNDKTEYYKGEWEDDTPHGQGKWTFADGDWYEGQWKNGKKHGRGTYKHATYDTYDYDGIKTVGGGGSYTGNWKNDKQDSCSIL